MKNRNGALDCARGLGIIIIMIYHLVYRAQGGVADKIIIECAWGIIPFYFMITGYFYKPLKYSVSEEIKRKTKGLLLKTVCIVGVLLIVFGIYCVPVHGYTPGVWFNDVVYTYLRPEFTNIIMRALGKPVDAYGILYLNLSPVWFIWVMFFSCTFFYPTANIAYKSPRAFVSVIAICVVLGTITYTALPPLSWNLNQVPAYVVIMLIASILGQMDFIEKMSKIGTHIVVLTMICAFIAHVILFGPFGTDQMYAGEIARIGVLSPVMYIFQACIWAYAFVSLGILIDKVPVLNRFLSWTGKNTNIFLLTHCIFAVVACDVMGTYTKPGADWYIADLTPDIIIKSIISFVFAFLCGACVIYARDLIMKKTGKPA